MVFSLFHCVLSQLARALFSLMLLIKYKPTKHLLVLLCVSATSQKECKQLWEKQPSAAATEARASSHQRFSKAPPVLFFLPTFEQQGQSVHKLQGKTGKSSVSGDPATRIQWQERGEWRHKEPQPTTADIWLFSAKWKVFSMLWRYGNNDGWKCITGWLSMGYHFNVVRRDKHSTKASGTN